MGTAHARLDALAVHGEVVMDTDRESVAPATVPSPVRVVRAAESPPEPAALPDAAAAPLSFASHRTKRCERRWEGFLALAEGRGVSADEVAARFGADDIADLCAPEHDDAVLERCMDTLVDAVRRERGFAGAGGRIVSAETHRWSRRRCPTGTLRCVPPLSTAGFPPAPRRLRRGRAAHRGGRILGRSGARVRDVRAATPVAIVRRARHRQGMGGAPMARLHDEPPSRDRGSTRKRSLDLSSRRIDPRPFGCGRSVGRDERI